MPHLEGIRIRNYRALHDITIGRTFETLEYEKMSRFIAVIGPNGSGKSTLMDVFGFIRDSLRLGVEEACEHPPRRGFERLKTRGQPGPIQFELYYREETNSRPISYSLSIDQNAEGRTVVTHERLRQRRKGQKRGHPFTFLEIENGSGYAWAGEATEEVEGSERIAVKLEDTRELGITTLGNLSEHPRIVAFRQFLEGWYLSYFLPAVARDLPVAGAQKHLSQRGENLANYLQYLERHDYTRFKNVLNRISSAIPGIGIITHKKTDDGRLLIQFNDQGYMDPFYQQDMSDGTLKMLAYLLLLEDPDPFPLIGIEEPENGLHHQLLEPLATTMRRYSLEKKGPQIIITTHSPYFVDPLHPQEVWIIEKNDHGHATMRRSFDIPLVKELYSEGIPLGSQWYSNHMGGIIPNVP